SRTANSARLGSARSDVELLLRSASAGTSNKDCGEIWERFRKTDYDRRNLGLPEAWVLRRNETDENDWCSRRSDGRSGSRGRRIPCDGDRSQYRTGRRPRRIAAGTRHRELGRAQDDEHERRVI